MNGPLRMRLSAVETTTRAPAAAVPAGAEDVSLISAIGVSLCLLYHVERRSAHITSGREKAKFVKSGAIKSELGDVESQFVGAHTAGYIGLSVNAADRLFILKPNEF